MSVNCYKFPYFMGQVELCSICEESRAAAGAPAETKLRFDARTICLI